MHTFQSGPPLCQILFNLTKLVFYPLQHNGKLRVNKQGVVFKSQKTGKVDQITANDIETIHWLKVARGYGLKIVLKDGTHYRFDGFKESVSIKFCP